MSHYYFCRVCLVDTSLVACCYDCCHYAISSLKKRKINQNMVRLLGIILNIFFSMFLFFVQQNYVTNGVMNGTGLIVALVLFLSRHFFFMFYVSNILLIRLSLTKVKGSVGHIYVFNK